MYTDSELALYEQMRRKSIHELISETSIAEIETALDVVRQMSREHNREWFGMIGTKWEREDAQAKRNAISKFEKARKMKLISDSLARPACVASQAVVK